MATTLCAVPGVTPGTAATVMSVAQVPVVIGWFDCLTVQWSTALAPSAGAVQDNRMLLRLIAFAENPVTGSGGVTSTGSPEDDTGTEDDCGDGPEEDGIHPDDVSGCADDDGAVALDGGAAPAEED